MPFVLGCLALVFPRVALFLVWLLGGNYLHRAYQHWIVPLLGFFLLPLTTLVYAFVHNSLGEAGVVTPLEWVFVAVAALLDVGLFHRGSGHANRWRQERW
jgi:hypothetical protein